MSTNNTSPMERARRRTLPLTVAGAALLSLTACSIDMSTEAASDSTVSSLVSTSLATTTSAPAITTTPPTTAARSTQPIDQLVDVQGVRLHVRCSGSGSTTVVLIAGFESGDDNWSAIEPDVAARTRVCAYARAGTGTSDAAVSTQTFTTQANQLRALLTEIGEPGPYVLVGHSFGGAEAVTFASKFADVMSGVVLIDASPATWPTDLCAVSDDGSNTAATVRTMCAGWSDPTANVEHLDVFTSFDQVAGVTSLGALPLTVITAIDRQFDDLGATELARLTQAWDSGQQRWSDLSTASTVVPVAATGHHIELDRPDVVIDAIAQLLP